MGVALMAIMGVWWDIFYSAILGKIFDAEYLISSNFELKEIPGFHGGKPQPTPCLLHPHKYPLHSDSQQVKQISQTEQKLAASTKLLQQP